MYSTYNIYTHINIYYRVACVGPWSMTMTAFIFGFQFQYRVTRDWERTCKLHTAYSIQHWHLHHKKLLTIYSSIYRIQISALCTVAMYIKEVYGRIMYTVIVSFHYFGNAAYIFGVPNAKLSRKKQTFIHTNPKVSNSNSIEIKLIHK